MTTLGGFCDDYNYNCAFEPFAESLWRTKPYEVNSDPTKNNYTDWIQEKILKEENIKVNFISIPRSDETSALNNMMAAGNPPDICLTYSLALIANYRERTAMKN